MLGLSSKIECPVRAATEKAREAFAEVDQMLKGILTPPAPAKASGPKGQAKAG